MNRVLVIGLVCLLACVQTGWCNGSAKLAPAKDCSEGLVNVIVDIVTAPCRLLVGCLTLGYDNLPFSSSSVQCAPVQSPKKVSKSVREGAPPVKIPGAPLPASKRTAVQNPPETGAPLPATEPTASPQSGPLTESRHSPPTVRIETYVPQEKPVPAGTAPLEPVVPKQAAGIEQPTVVRPGQELLERIPGESYRPSKPSVEVPPPTAKVDQLSPSKVDQPTLEKTKPLKAKSGKTEKRSYHSPCMPTYPVYPCVPGPYFR